MITKGGADAICDLLWQLYRSNDKEIAFTTGYYDPEEDARQGEEIDTPGGITSIAEWRARYGTDRKGNLRLVH